MSDNTKKVIKVKSISMQDYKKLWDLGYLIIFV